MLIITISDSYFVLLQHALESNKMQTANIYVQKTRMENCSMVTIWAYEAEHNKNVTTGSKKSEVLKRYVKLPLGSAVVWHWDIAVKLLDRAAIVSLSMSMSSLCCSCVWWYGVSKDCDFVSCWKRTRLSLAVAVGRTIVVNDDDALSMPITMELVNV